MAEPAATLNDDDSAVRASAIASFLMIVIPFIVAPEGADTHCVKSQFPRYYA